MSISIVNLRQTRNCIRVDRATDLGNPFRMADESQRDRVCENYELWLREQFRIKGSNVNLAVNRLANEYYDKRSMTLGCWCAPKRCHAVSIRDLILSLVEG